MAEYIERRQAIKLVYDARRSPPIKGVLTDTMSWAIAAVNDIPAADVQPVKWISVEEQLPQGGDESGQLCENVILMLSVEYNEAYVTCGWINGVTKKAYYLDEIDDFIHKTDISNVKAWMPLPEPPKDGET